MTSALGSQPALSPGVSASREAEAAKGPEEARPLLSVVIPMYRCRAFIDELYRRLVVELSRLSPHFEVLFVDDASPDDDWSPICELAKKDPRVRGIRLSRNFGQHCAITAGLDRARGEWIVVMDGDLQDRPEEIPALYAHAQEGHDIVFARRSVRMDGFFKRLSSRAFYWVLSYLTDTKLDASIANFGIYHFRVIEAVQQMRESLRYFPVMVRWVGFSASSLDVEHAGRSHGRSSYTLPRLLRMAVDVMMTFSDKPLWLTVKLGVALSLLSFVAAAYTVYNALFGDVPIMGWSSLIVSVWFFSGIVIMLVGVVGIYVGKTFDQVKSRPLYVVRGTTYDPGARV